MSKLFPIEEMYSLTDQIRRSSRSIGANISESWAKRRYLPHFISKLSDAEGEAEETVHWIGTAFACDYVDARVKEDLIDKCEHIAGMLNNMMLNADSWCKNYKKQ